MDNFPEESHVVSVMIQESLETMAKMSSPAPNSKAKQTDGEGQSGKNKSSLDKSEIPCRFKFCENPSCKFWHLNQVFAWMIINSSRRNSNPLENCQ